MCIKRKKKQHMERQMNNNIHHHIYKREIKVQCILSINGHKTGVQKDNVSKKKEKKST